MNASHFLILSAFVQLTVLIITLVKILISIGSYKKSIENLEVANGNFNKKIDGLKECLIERIDRVNARIDNHTTKIYSEIKEINNKLTVFEGRISKLEGKIEI